MGKVVVYGLIVLLCALAAVWMAAFLFKAPDATIQGWLQQNPGRALLVGGAVVGIAVW